MRSRGRHFSAAGAVGGIGSALIAVGAIGVIVGSAQASAAAPHGHLDLWGRPAFVGGVLVAAIGVGVALLAVWIIVGGWWHERSHDDADYALSWADPLLDIRLSAPNRVSVQVTTKFANSYPHAPIEFRVKTLKASSGAARIDYEVPDSDEYRAIAPSGSDGTTFVARLDNLDLDQDRFISMVCTVSYGVLGGVELYEREWEVRAEMIRAPGTALSVAHIIWQGIRSTQPVAHKRPKR